MIISLQIDQFITPTRPINAVMVSHWTYARECSNVGDGLVPGTEMRVVEVSKVPGAMWVRAEVGGGDPPPTKIAGAEYGNNFRLLR